MTTINADENNALRQSTATTVDLMSARAAIDETFGIIKRPSITANHLIVSAAIEQSNTATKL